MQCTSSKGAGAHSSSRTKGWNRTPLTLRGTRVINLLPQSRVLPGRVKSGQGQVLHGVGSAGVVAAAVAAAVVAEAAAPGAGAALAGRLLEAGRG